MNKRIGFGQKVRVYEVSNNSGTDNNVAVLSLADSQNICRTMTPILLAKMSHFIIIVSQRLVQSLAKLRIEHCPSVRPSVRSSFRSSASCLTSSTTSGYGKGLVDHISLQPSNDTLELSPQTEFWNHPQLQIICCRLIGQIQTHTTSHTAL